MPLHESKLFINKNMTKFYHLVIQIGPTQQQPQCYQDYLNTDFQVYTQSIDPEAAS